MTPESDRCYAEPSICTERPACDFPWETIEAGKPLVYCCFGTQSLNYKTAVEIFQKVLIAFGKSSTHQLVVSAGPFLDTLAPFSRKGLFITRTVPQLELLNRANLAIIHGGLGSIKESIMARVPMIVVPFHADQPANAARIRFHKLGDVWRAEDMSPRYVLSQCDSVLDSLTISKNLQTMHELFWTSETKSPSVRFVEQFLQTSENVTQRCTSRN